MKTIKLLPLLIPVLLLSSCNLIPSTSVDNFDGKEIKLKADLSSANRTEISPFVYGTFIEHIETCIYGGIWAEIIQDRKFYKPVGSDVSQWFISSGVVDAEVINPFEGNYSPILREGASIRQNGLSLKDVSYDGYLYAKGNGKLEVKYVLDDEEIKKEIDINSSNYQKYSYNFTSNFNSNKVKLYITSLSQDITIDSVSLMPSDNYYGMRKDTLDILKELNSPFYRWPGGNFVSGYDFYDGIGDRDTRPTKRNLNYCGREEDFHSDSERLSNDLIKIGSLGFYGAFEPNDYGIDEFIKMCRYINAEPNIVLNSGLGSVEMARDEVEYCNGTSGYGLLRPESEPYGVTYFSIGNEMNGDWQLGHMDVNSYTKKHNDIANAIKSVDSNIKIIAVGDNYSSWTQTMVDNCKANMDYTSEHYYAERKENDVKDHILSLREHSKLRINKHRNIRGIGTIKMAIDEYAYAEAIMASRLKDGMGVASALNVFHENADIVGLACYSSTVNATQGNMITDKLNAYMEGSGYALSLYASNMQNHYLPISYSTYGNGDYYELSATINEDKTLMSVSVINTSDKPLRISSDVFKNVTKLDYVCGEYLESINNKNREELHRYTISTSGTYFDVAPLSITVATVEL